MQRLGRTVPHRADARGGIGVAWVGGIPSMENAKDAESSFKLNTGFPFYVFY